MCRLADSNRHWFTFSSSRYAQTKATKLIGGSKTCRIIFSFCNISFTKIYTQLKKILRSFPKFSDSFFMRKSKTVSQFQTFFRTSQLHIVNLFYSLHRSPTIHFNLLLDNFYIALSIFDCRRL